MHKHGLRVWDRVFGWKRRAEARATLLHAREFLQPGARVLDVGCGIGYMLEVLEEDFGCEALGCDVVTPPNPLKGFVRFDGNRLPYRDKSIDVALLIFVLHHAEEPSVLLREASRIARRAVIVVEDTPCSALERRWGAMHIHSFNKRHGIPWHGRVRAEEEWRRLFHAMEMPLLNAERLGRFERLPPVSRSAFVLAPAAVGAAPLMPLRKRGGKAATTS